VNGALRQSSNVNESTICKCPLLKPTAFFILYKLVYYGLPRFFIVKAKQKKNYKLTNVVSLMIIRQTRDLQSFAKISRAYYRSMLVANK
jgi:hypothetical protein